MSDLISHSKVKEKIMGRAVNICNPKTLGTEDTMHVLDTMQAVSDEEFKVEAKRRGYNLIKIPEKVKLLSCVCSKKNPQCWCSVDTDNKYELYVCSNCDLEAPKAKTNRKARLNWNKMIEEKMKDGKTD